MNPHGMLFLITRCRLLHPHNLTIRIVAYLNCVVFTEMYMTRILLYPDMIWDAADGARHSVVKQLGRARA